MKKVFKKKWIPLFLAVLITLSSFLPGLTAYAEDLNGLLINLENEEGESLTNGTLSLFENHPPNVRAAGDSWARYDEEEIFRAAVDNGEVFIPNAYLLKGKEYTIFIEAEAKDGKQLIFTHQLTADGQTNLTLGNDDIKKVTVDTDITHTQGNVVLQALNVDGKVTHRSYPLHLQDGHAEFYLSSNMPYVVQGQFLNESTDTGYLLTKRFDVNATTEISLNNSEDLFSVTAPNGEYESSVEISDEWYSNLHANKYFVSPNIEDYMWEDIRIGYSITKDGYTYDFYRWDSSLEDTQINHDSNIQVELDTYEEIEAGKTIDVRTEYRTSDWYYLDEVVASDSVDTATTGILMDRVNADGKSTTYNAQLTDQGVVYTQNEETSSAQVVYALNNEQNEEVDTVQAEINYEFEYTLPSEPGNYTLQLKEQSFPNTIANLSSNSLEFSIEGETSPNDSIIDVELPEGYNGYFDSLSLIGVTEDGTDYDREYLSWTSDSSEGIYQLDFKNVDIYDQYNYELHVPLNLRESSTNEQVLLYQVHKFTGAELKDFVQQGGTLELLTDLNKVTVDMSSFENYEINKLKLFNMSEFDLHLDYRADIHVNNNTVDVWTNEESLRFGQVSVSSEDHKAYHMRKDVVLDDQDTITFDDELSNVNKVTFENNGESIPFKRFNISTENQYSYTHDGFYVWHDGYPNINELYVTPGQYEIGIYTTKDLLKETPWDFGWNYPGMVDATEGDVAIQFTGDIERAQFNDDYFNVRESYSNSGTYDIYGEVDLGSKDLNLRYVYVYREYEQPNRSLGQTYPEQVTRTSVNEQGMVVPEYEYEGDFRDRERVKGTLTLYDSEDNIVVKGEMDWQNFSLNDIELDSGNYTLEYKLPIGPNQEKVITKDISIEPPVGQPVVQVTEQDNDLNVSWDQVEGAVSYNVLVAEEDGTFEQVATNITTTNYTYQGIQNAGITYKIKVEAVADNGATNTSDIIEYTSTGLKLSLTSDFDVYEPGMGLQISGQTTIDGSGVTTANPSLTVKDANQNVIYSNQWAETEIASDGSFATNFTLAEDATLGEYTITLKADGRYITKTIRIVDSLMELSLEVENTEYAQGNNVVVTGQVLYQGEALTTANPTLKVTSPSGNVVYTNQWDESGIATDGTFTANFTLEDNAELGEYTIALKADDQEVTKSFTVKDTLAEKAVTLNLDKAKYVPGNTVTITGEVTLDGEALKGADVSILVQKDGNQLKADQVVTSEDGTYTSAYVLPQDADLGDYQVQVSSIDTTVDQSFTVVEANEPVITKPEQEQLFNTEDVTVSGYAKADATLIIEATKQDDDSVVVSEEVTANTEGAFTGTLTLNEDGHYDIIVKEQANTEAKSEVVTITVDTTAPTAPELTVVENAEGLALSWSEDADAINYDVFAAEEGNELQTVATNVEANTYTYTDIEPDTTYEFQVKAYDEAGNVVASDVVDYTTAAFKTSNLDVTAEQEEELLHIGSNVAISLKGSYQEGFEGKATVSYVKDGQDQTLDLTLNYDAETESYEGTFYVEEGISELKKVSAFITDGSEQTEEVTTDVDRNVGATIKGSVTQGGEALTSGTVYISSKNVSVNTDINEDGTFQVKGLEEGDYSLHVNSNGSTFYSLVTDVELNYGQVTSDVEVSVPSYQDVSIKFVDENDELIQDDLYLELEGEDEIDTYYSGYINEGYFANWSGNTTLKGLQDGWYELSVEGSANYEDKNQSIAIEPGKDYVENPITVVLTEREYNTTEITLSFKTEDGSNIESPEDIYWNLYNDELARETGYDEGYYTSYDLEEEGFGTWNEDGTLTINVVEGYEYQIYGYAEGFMNYQATQTFNADTNTHEFVFDPGVSVTGTIELPEGYSVDGSDVRINAYTQNPYSYGIATIDRETGDFEIKGLASDADIQLDISALEMEKYKETITSNGEESFDVGTIQLNKAKFVDGKVYDEDGETPVKHVRISVYKVNEDSSWEHAGWARTDKDGYFKVYGLSEGNYVVETYKYGYPSVTTATFAVPSDQQNQTIILQEEGTGDYTGEGNSFAASVNTVVPGKNIQYVVNYQNTGDATTDNLPLYFSLPESVELIKNSVTLNGETATATLVDGQYQVDVTNVEAGESGELVFEANVKTDANEAVRASAQISDDGERLSTTTNVLFITLTAPEKTSEKNVKVYGNAKVGSTIKVYANNQLVTETQAEGRWWYANVDLPIQDDQSTESFDLHAVVEDGSLVYQTDQVEVDYEPSIPSIENVTVHAGWNGDVELNPNTGVATFAVVEKTAMDTEVEFSKDVESASIVFLGETYEMTSNGDGEYTFDGSELGAWSSYGEQMLELEYVTKEGVTVRVPLMEIIVLIDPSGYVFEGSMDNRLEGVNAVVQQLNETTGEWEKWNADFFGQVNPQMTDENGRYGWDVIEGKWRVIFSKDGYETYISRIVEVPPAETQLNVPMVRSDAPAVSEVAPTDKGKDIEVDESIEVTFDRLMLKSSVTSNIQVVNQSTGEAVSGTFETPETFVGYKEDKVGEVSVDLADGLGQTGWFAEDSDVTLAKRFIFNPDSNLSEGTNYEVKIESGVLGYGNKPMVESNQFSFTTKQSNNDGGGVIIPAPTPSIPAPEESSAVSVDVSLSDDKEESIELSAADLEDAKAKGLSVVADDLTIEVPARVFANKEITSLTLKKVTDLTSLDEFESVSDLPEWADSMEGVVQVKADYEGKSFSVPAKISMKSNATDLNLAKFVEVDGKLYAMTHATKWNNDQAEAHTNSFGVFGLIAAPQEVTADIKEGSATKKVTLNAEGDVYYTTNTSLVDYLHNEDEDLTSYMSNSLDLAQWAKYEGAFTVENDETVFALNLNDNVVSQLANSVKPETKVWDSMDEVEASKEFTITFNEALRASTIGSHSVYVTDEDGERIDVDVELADGKTIMVTPKDRFVKGQEYTLHISQNIKAQNGHFLKQPVEMTFSR